MELKTSQRLRYPSVTASICRVVIFGTLFVAAVITMLLFISFEVDDNQHTVGCLVLCATAFLYMAGTYWCLRRDYYRIVAYLLILFYLLMASSIVCVWGINTPIGLLIFALVIILTGILLTARSALGAALICSLLLFAVQAAGSLNWYRPDASWTTMPSTFYDAFAYSAMFSMLALMSWLYNREMERSLYQVRQTEAALRKQKVTLKQQVRDQTKDLRRMQLEEMRQMYRFAELGQLGITLLHDLANHVAVLQLEIEGIKDTRYLAEVIRAQQIIRYLGGLVDRTRRRLHGDTEKQTFDIVRKISETVDFLHYKATQNNVSIDWQSPLKTLKYVGDPDSFCQIVAIVTSNAIDAYGKSGTVDRRVSIVVKVSDTHVTILIRDWGKAIAKTRRKLLFKPHYSTKKSGLGLGLYIAKQTLEMQFSGAITLGSQRDCTEFTIRLPRSNGR